MWLPSKFNVLLRAKKQKNNGVLRQPGEHETVFNGFSLVSRLAWMAGRAYTLMERFGLKWREDKTIANGFIQSAAAPLKRG